VQEAIGDLTGLALCFFLLERIDQFDRREEGRPSVKAADQAASR